MAEEQRKRAIRVRRDAPLRAEAERDDRVGWLKASHAEGPSSRMHAFVDRRQTDQHCPLDQ